MKEIAAIGADFRQLSSFTDDAGPTSDPLKSINNNNNNACSGFQTNGMGSHEQILIGKFVCLLICLFVCMFQVCLFFVFYLWVSSFCFCLFFILFLCFDCLLFDCKDLFN